MPKKTVTKKLNQQIKTETVQAVDGLGRAIHFSPKAMGILADEIAKGTTLPKGDVPHADDPYGIVTSPYLWLILCLAELVLLVQCLIRPFR
jgi:hypothetical protein